ncbi:DegT/DnrJ/EryC1/StrS family aminotransferase [Alteromonas facilis]|uniref:DegT/DnrJ/EryC1/StrS family aminotransferase n=1 Tax=Alteromonas facilis TaxID=2048004 RepID=UPI000C295107|nr:DegT/DnrJ/EryC1/StrS family aminotransferase [Alteromonas facilis]
MSLSLTPPVGTPATLKRTTHESFDCLVGGTQYTLVQSGTAALALALLVAKRHKADKNEVIIPAYGCPDLVAAIEYAGLVAVVVDVFACPYSYCEEALNSSLNENTLAIVCPTLLGIRMPINALRNTVGNELIIIEDNAQWLPSSTAKPVIENSGQTRFFDDSFEPIDMSIVSFGRGKPVNLLGGGALFLHNSSLTTVFESLTDALGHVQIAKKASTDNISLKYRLKASLFNFLCSPLIYGAVARLPFLSIGETKFHPLMSIEALGNDQKQLLVSAIKAYLAHEPKAEVKLRKLKPDNKMAEQTHNRLLRYPLLCFSKTERDALIRKLSLAGIGASPFYNALLPEIDDVDSKVKRYAEIKHAKVLADKMLTLPVHPGISTNHVDVMISNLDNVLPTSMSVN